MTIQIKSIYDPIEGNEGKRFMITRFHPKKGDRQTKISLKQHGISLWLRDLAPTYDLLQDWKDGQVGTKLEDFKKRYFHELDDASCALGSKEKVKKAIELIKEAEHYDGNVTLVTFPTELHNGYMLKEYITTLEEVENINKLPVLS